MPVNVEEYLGEIPERCLKCPALQSAANTIDAWYGLTSMALEERMDIGNFEDDSAAPASVPWAIISLGATQEARRLHASCSKIAQELVSACAKGPEEQHSTRRVRIKGMSTSLLGRLLQRRQIIETDEDRIYTACTSSAPAAQFAPSKSYNYLSNKSLVDPSA